MERKIYLYTNEIIALKAGKYVSPITCEIDLSNKCMLQCAFCMYTKYREAEDVDLDFALYKRLLEELEACGVESITFTGGGEPLMHPQANAMIDLAVKKGFDIGLVTNGVLLHQVSDYLLKAFKFIRVSLDAASKETYVKIKGVDCFNRVIKNIDALITLRTPLLGPTVGLSYVVCKQNALEVLAAEDLAKELDVDYIQFKPAWMNGQIYTFSSSNTEKGVFITQRYRVEDTLACSIAGLIGIVGANGKLYYCCQHRGKKHYEVGDLRDASFEQLWRQRKNIEPSLDACPQCRYVNYAKKFKEIPQMLLKHRRFL